MAGKVSVSGWTFDGNNSNISGGFDDHMRKSIPGYDMFEDLSVKLCDWHMKDGAVVLDLGCATGNFVCALAKRHYDKNVNVFAVDYSDTLLGEARSKFEEEVGDSKVSVEFVAGDLSNSSIQDFIFFKSSKRSSVDIISCLFTLQFLSSHDKKRIIGECFETLKPGGILIIADKFLSPCSDMQVVMDNLYDEFKVDNDISPAEVYNKRLSLRGVQKCETEYAYSDYVELSGFSKGGMFLRVLNFAGYYFIKE